MSFIITIAVVVVIVLFVISVYNSLVRARMQTQEAWSQIDVQLKRRNDLLPNLIETVKGYGKYEQATLEKVTQLRAQVASASSPADAMKASAALTRQISGIFAVAESYPDLKANENYLKLQEELTNTENKISYARQLYNSSVARYNISIQSIPTNIIAGFGGFTKEEMLETPVEARKVPEVKF